MVVLNRYRNSTRRQATCDQMSIWVPIMGLAPLLVTPKDVQVFPFQMLFASYGVCYVFGYLVKTKKTEQNENDANFEFSNWWTGLLLTITGLVALSFRQTNIFWVAIFPAGLAIRDLMRNQPLPNNLVTRYLSQYCNLAQYEERTVGTAVAEGMCRTS